MPPTVYRMMTLLCSLVVTLPIGTNLGLLHLRWMLVSGQLLAARGAVIPGLSACGLSERSVRRAWAARGQGTWACEQLLARQAEAVARDYDNEGAWGQTCAALPDDTLNFQHDPLTCAVALGWDGVMIEQARVSAEMREGWLYERVDEGGQAMRIVIAVDGARFNELWLRLVTA